MKITLKNNFHNTQATVISRDGIISTSSLRRATRKLCGMDGCTCGGIHGPQDVGLRGDIDRDGNGILVVE